MNKLPIDIQNEFFKLFDGIITIEYFESWIYEHNELERYLEKEDYLEFISLNFNDSLIIKNIKELLHPYLEFGENQEGAAINKTTILKNFHLTDIEIKKLSEEAKSIAIGYGKKGHDTQLDKETWSLFDDISDYIWEIDSLDIKEKVLLCFDIFEIFPSVHHFLTPYWYALRNNELENIPDVKVIIWKQFAKYLDSEHYYADPVSYTLWCDFFEDHTMVEESWKGIVKEINNDKCFAFLLQVAGPVPFELKNILYQKLLPNEIYHQEIFNSLLYSAYDCYGIIDIPKAKLILKRLKINHSSKEFGLLKTKLNWSLLDNFR